MVAGHLCGGHILSVVVIAVVLVRENCCFKTSAYDLLVGEYTGLLRHHGSSAAGGLMPGGIDF